ncbi:hypothetical protein SAMN05216436_11486 [bacterium A37T11]|nr:hypothetical protein SAMN05216436_11486 [bacterium A37T11]
MAHTNSLINWTEQQKLVFRIAFVMLIFLCVPTDLEWYQHLINYNWSALHWNYLYSIAASGRPLEVVTIPGESGRWGLASYTNTFVIFFIAILLGLIWTRLDKKSRHYNKLNYWIRVVARYQLGFAIIAWGYRKIVPLQMMWPPTNLLNTPLLYIQEQKIYWQSIGIVPSYEIFLGFAEFFSGFFLLFRKTTGLGALLTVVVLANIVIINHTYDGGVHIPSFTFVLVALILLWRDLPNVYALLIKEKTIQPHHYYYPFSKTWEKYSRYLLKFTGFAIFVVLEFFLHLFGEPKYRVPDRPGLKNKAGYYHVTEFRLNNRTIAYSPFDSLRWQDAILEDWATLAFKVNRKEIIDQSNGPSLKPGGGLVDDIDRGWESAGVQGRHFFYYVADTVNQILYLQNKNKLYRDERQILHYSFPSKSRILFSGINEYKDSIYVVLDRIDMKYPVISSRHSAQAF